MSSQAVFIIGAGPAGLAAANELAECPRFKPTILEKADQAGGLSRTVEHRGYLFDIGGHRFYTEIDKIHQLWRDALGNDLKKVERRSRIYYDEKFFHYPLQKRNVLFNLGLLESLSIISSYMKSRLFPATEEKTFDRWIINRFGLRLYETFFKSYTEKVWGMPCSTIQSDWAAQRIQGLSLAAAVTELFLGKRQSRSTIDAFWYPVRGPGMMWEAFERRITSGGGELIFNAEATRLHHNGKVITDVEYHQSGLTVIKNVDHVISTIPINHLVMRLDPRPPESVIRAAAGLSYRSFVIVNLIINERDLFPDQWIYIHWPGVNVSRIQNFKNWSAAMVPNPETTSIGMEYFCNEGDGVWRMSDSALTEMAVSELETLGFTSELKVIDSLVIRQPNAYPVYDGLYHDNLSVVREYLAGFGNLQTVGRNGMHRYNNMDHSMMSGIQAAQNLAGGTG